MRDAKGRLLLLAAALLLAALIAGCGQRGEAGETPPPSPSLPETAASALTSPPGEEGEPVPVMEALGLAPEEIEKLTYSAGFFGERTLRKGETGFDEAIALLISLRGTPAKVPRAVARLVKLNDSGIPLVLEYDGERVHASLGWSDNYLLDSSGRPDLELEDIFARYAPKPIREPVSFDFGSYTAGGELILMPEKPDYDEEALRTAVESSLLRLRERGPEDSTAPEEGAIVHLMAENKGEEEVYYGFPFLLAYHDGGWFRVPTRTEYVSDLIPRSIAPGQTLETGLRMDDYDDPLYPGLYRACMTYHVGFYDKGSRYDHIAWTEFEITETEDPDAPAPERLIRDREPEEIDVLRYTLPTWDYYTLRRGDEGFEEALTLLLSLQGQPCGQVYCPIYRQLDFGDSVRSIYLESDGRHTWGSYDGRWLELKGASRPDLELAAIFERHGEWYVPAAEKADHSSQREDGSLQAYAEFPSYDCAAVQAAIQMEKRDYLATADRNHAPDDAWVKLTLENRTEGALKVGNLAFEALRDGEWVGVELRSGFGIASMLFTSEIAAGETMEAWIQLSVYNDPLTAGDYRAAIPYTAGEADPLKDGFDRVTYAFFRLSDGAPEPDDGTELLMGRTKREKVKSIVYTMSIGDNYTLDRGEVGFAQVLETIFSLRGVPCDRPESLVFRTFDLGVGPDITLAFDGEHIYGRRLTDQWLLLDTEGRIDQELTETFLRWGEKETPVYFDGPLQYKNLREDASVVLTAERATFELAALLEEMEEFRREYREDGRQETEEIPSFVLRFRLENRSEETIHFGNGVDLEALRDGEWKSVHMRRGYGIAGVGLSLKPGEGYDALGFSLLAYYEEALTPGLYRACLTYKFGSDQGRDDHAAYAEFEIRDSLPEN